MKKTAFSYLELLFGMVIVVSIFLASVPFVTHRITVPTSVSGEYVCFTAYNNSTVGGTGSFRLYESIKRAGGAYSTPVDVTDVGCTFFKQKNVKQYTVTVIGGGGAGNVPENVNDAGSRGGNGERITVTTSLAGTWDDAGILTINKCKKSDVFINTNPYEEEFKHCVGSGGESYRTKGAGAAVGQKINFYDQLVSVYHDLAYELRENVEEVVYAGKGNGLLEATDNNVLNNFMNNTYIRSCSSDTNCTSIYTLIRNYVSATGATKATYKQNLKDREIAMWLNRILINNVLNVSGNSEGAQGGYSRFVIYDNTSLSCPNGNCIVRGGAGAYAHNAYTTDTCAATANCNGTNTVVGAIVLNNWTNYFGKGGAAAGIRKIGGTTTRGGRSPVGNGGAIVIRW